MGLKQRLRYLEKQHLRPFFRRVSTRFSALGGGSAPPHLQARLEALEARVAELEQVVQEDLGIRLSEPGTSTSHPRGEA